MQINIAAFFYIGALNEALGHANRAAKLLHNAAAIARKSGDCDALTLKRNPKISRRRTSSRRESDGVKTCVAEFTEVTVKNPFNVTLINDLSMQVQLHLHCAPHCAVAPRSSIIRNNCSPPPTITQPRRTPHPSPDTPRPRLPHIRPFRLRQVVTSARHGQAVDGRRWLRSNPAACGTRRRFFLPQRALSPIASVISILIV